MPTDDERTCYNCEHKVDLWCVNPKSPLFDQIVEDDQTCDEFERDKIIFHRDE